MFEIAVATAPLAAACKRAGVELRLAEAGDPWYTWRGSLRSYYPGTGRQVWNALRDGELVGSMCMRVYDGSPYDGGPTIDYADSLAAFTGPLYADPSYFENGPLFLAMESVYVCKHARRSGIAAALVEATRTVGLPVFSEFADDRLGRRCEELHEAASLDEDDEMERFLDTPAFNLFQRIEDADMSGSEAFDTSELLFADGERAEATFTLVCPYDCDEPRSPDDGDERGAVPEGTPEDDRARYGNDQVDEEEIGDRLGNMHVALRKAGVEVEDIRCGRLRRYPAAGHDRVRVYLSATVTNAALLAACACWRRFLAELDPEWEPASPADALTACLRGPTGLYSIERMRIAAPLAAAA